jgi:DNA repair photolyase
MIVPEPQPGSLQELCQRVSRMADTDDMCPAVKKYLDDMFEPLRQQGINLSFTVSAGRRGRNRINFGDWVELVGIRVENRLGKVVGNDKLDRPRVRWFNSGSWQSARSFIHNSDGKLHVFSPDEARDKFPDAFACYRLTAAETEKSLDGPEANTELEAKADSDNVQRLTIYRPSGRAYEYAELACNPYLGCSYKCTYCFGPSTLSMTREKFNAGAVPKKDFLRRLNNDAEKLAKQGVTGQVLVTFVSDPYHAGDTSLTRETIKVLQDNGFGVCVLTKGGTRALRDLDLFRPDKDCFACTVTSVDEAFIHQWEPVAPPPSDRLAALKAFNAAGIFTWISLEPVLDPVRSVEVIDACHEFVSLFKVGKPNYIKTDGNIDWADFTRRCVDRCESLGKKLYVKESLQGHLPEGFVNEMRMTQHF